MGAVARGTRSGLQVAMRHFFSELALRKYFFISRGRAPSEIQIFNFCATNGNLRRRRIGSLVIHARSERCAPPGKDYYYYFTLIIKQHSQIFKMTSSS